MRGVLTVLLLFAAAWTLGGCLGNPELVARWKKICTDQGYVEGTPAFDKCWDDNRPQQSGGAVDHGGGP